MKYAIPGILLCITHIVVFAQSPVDILRRSHEACMKITSGSYIMTREMKYMSNEDTTTTEYACSFKKLESDTLFPIAFYNTGQAAGEIRDENIYTGQALAQMRPKDSVAVIIMTDRWAEYINSISHNYEFYTPLTSMSGAPLKNILDTTESTLRFIDEQIINGIPTYHVEAVQYPDNEPDDMLKSLSVTWNLWINKADHIPIQYSEGYVLLLGSDTMTQYELLTLNSYVINAAPDEQKFTLDAIPSYYHIEDYIPYDRPDPLPLDTIAPDWTLPSLDGNEIRLEDLRGKVVLVDFFYKSCYPCLLALPSLQALHEKYQAHGLRVIGVDPFDKIEDGVGAFLGRRGVTYPVVLEARDVSKAYRITGYPTVYVIDKEGRIIHHQVGFGDESANELDLFIQKVLFNR